MLSIDLSIIELA